VQHDPRRADEPCRCLPPIRLASDTRTMSFFANMGPQSGPILWQEKDQCRAIGVLGSPHDPRPIGTALQVGRTEGGIAIWSIAVEGRELPGRWIVLGREFIPKTEDERPRGRPRRR
jgi:hypothetical protein